MWLFYRWRFCGPLTDANSDAPPRCVVMDSSHFASSSVHVGRLVIDMPFDKLSASSQDDVCPATDSWHRCLRSHHAQRQLNELALAHGLA